MWKIRRRFAFAWRHIFNMILYMYSNEFTAHISKCNNFSSCWSHATTGRQQWRWQQRHRWRWPLPTCKLFHAFYVDAFSVSSFRVVVVDYDLSDHSASTKRRIEAQDKIQTGGRIIYSICKILKCVNKSVHLFLRTLYFAFCARRAHSAQWFKCMWIYVS